MRVLLLNQCFHPDHVATAQYLADLALALREAGHEVTAVASSRGYDDPSTRYPARETWQGVEIHRIWTPGLGKGAKWRRLVDFGMFWLSATWILLRLPRFDVTVCLTSPPLISSLGTLVAALKGGAVVPWVMDLNPDEAVAAGWLRAGGLPERLLSALQRWSFRRAAKIIALDRFMQARLLAKGVTESVVHVDPPWAQDHALAWTEEARAAFRARHGLEGRFVVMYAGNHSPCHPLQTALEGALELARAGEERIAFVFMGGGSEQARVRDFATRHALSNVVVLPYQPRAELAPALAAADLHLVVMGAPFVGMIHPCKVYNILALGLPFIGICPEECHLTDLARHLPDARYARHVRHGEAAAFVREVRAAAEAGRLPPSPEARALAATCGQEVLRPRLVALVEQAAPGGARA